MKNIFITLTILLVPLYAQTIKAGYDVSFGIIGEIGKSEITYKEQDNSYTIVVEAWTTGMASVLSRNRQEKYISQGKIINGVLRPDVFVKYKHTDIATYSNVFVFDHVQSQVLIIKNKEYKTSSTDFDVSTMKNIKVITPKFETYKEPFNFYTDNDILSLFFNTQKILPSFKEGESKKLAAIGSKTANCVVDIEVPTNQKRKELQAIMSSDQGQLLTIILHQDIFQSEQGKLHVIFDEDGFAENVLLKDVILFGDIRGKRTYQEVNGIMKTNVLVKKDLKNFTNTLDIK